MRKYNIKKDSLYMPSLLLAGETKNNLQLAGEIRLLTRENQPENTPTKFHLFANSGQPMQVEGFEFPVIVDLQGVAFDKNTTPIIQDHDAKIRIGHTTRQLILREGQQETVDKEPLVGPLIFASGVVSSTTIEAKEFDADLKANFPFQVSIGAPVLEAESIPEGQDVTVNGVRYSGPILVARKIRIRELSVLTLGADNNTTVKIAAQNFNPGSIKTMNFEEYLQSLGFEKDKLSEQQTANLKAQWDAQQAGTINPPTNPSTPPPTNPPSNPPATNPGENILQATRQQVANDALRVDSIQATASQFSHVQKIVVGEKELTVGQLKATAIKEGWTPDKFELELRRAEIKEETGNLPAAHIKHGWNDVANNQVLQCVILKQASSYPANNEHKVTGQRYGWEHDFKEEVLEASDNPRLRNVSLHQIFDYLILQSTGLPYSGNRHSHEFIEATRKSMFDLRAAGFTTLDITQIFDDVANKMLWAGYQSINTTWQEWVRPVTVTDFKTHNMYRLTLKGAYEQVGPDGELKHGGFTDQKYTAQANTYGKIIQLTRHHLINDDMGAFDTLMTALGIEAAKSLEEEAYFHLLNNATTIFPTAGTNNNYLSGATSALSIQALSDAAQLFEDQIDDDNAPLLIQPDRILVGTANRVLASQLFNNTEVREGRGGSSTKAEFTNNPHVGAFRPIVSGYLNNTNILQRVKNIGDAIPAQSATQWFMFPNPAIAQGAVVMGAFLNGNRTPFLERADANFDVLGFQWRAYHDWGFSTGDPKLGVHVKGAA